MRSRIQVVEDQPKLLQELRAEFGSRATFDFDIARSDGSALFVSERLQQPRLHEAAAAATPATFDVRRLPGLGELRVLRRSGESR